MTLNIGTGASPSLHQQQTHSPQIHEPPSPLRRYSVGSPQSSAFKPTVVSSSPAFHTASPQFLPLLSPQQELTVQPRSFSTEKPRSNSQAHKVFPSARRRQYSKSPERNRGGTGQGNGRRSYQHQTACSKQSTPTMQGRRNELEQLVADQQPLVRYGRSNSSIQSNSVPSTPNHNPRQSSELSRSPSPPCLLDSPRSATSEPITVSPYTRSLVGGCIYETALVNARRRMPYALGNDKITPAKPKQEKLAPEQEAKLTEDMLDLFEILKPDNGSSQRRRRFLVKLEGLLNDEWPGHDIKVHAFGSTENHLCMSDSDVDVCITTQWKDFNHVCRLARALAKHGMERVVCVPGAKVPIVKVWDPEYEVACDMNINNTLALDNTKMIKTYVEIDDRVRPLAMIIKHWTKQRSLNDAAGGGTLSSYTWICMILNFLQTRDPPILPSLHQRPHKKRPPICGVDISFDDDIESLRGFGLNNKETLGGLMFAFFKKFGFDLDYDTNVISVRHGNLLTKKEKGWQFKQNNRLCVEEPFNTARNLGNTADDYSWRGLHLEFRRVYQILAEKADLAACYELFVFPPEEPHAPLQPHPPQHRPVAISRSNSGHGKPRNVYNGRGRGSHWHLSNRSNQKRTSNGGAYGVQLPHYLPQDLIGYIQTPQEQILALQAQFQAHSRAQVQAVQQVHAHAQIHGQQSQLQSTTGSINSVGSTQNHQDTLALHQFTSYAYFAQLWGMNLYYPSPLYPESPPTPTSPHIMNDSRNAHGRGRHQDGYNSGSRSQPQPPSEMYQTPNYGNGTSTIGIPGSEDEDLADHCSSENPATPLEEEPDEYVGYYAIGGSLQHVPTVVDSVDEEEEPFLEQKSIVDRQKRLSQERLPPPQLGKSRDASGVLCLDNLVPRDCHKADQGPVIVNGSISVPSSPGTGSPFSNPTTPSEAFYPYDGPHPDMDHHGSGGTSDLPTTEPKGVTGQTQLFAQKLLEVHTQAAGNHSENGLTTSNLAQQHTDGSISSSMSAFGILSSPKSTSQPSQLASDDDGIEAITPTRLSPCLRQRAATQQLLWSNTRASTMDILKFKGCSSAQEDISHPLTHVSEILTSSPVPGKKGSESDLHSKQQKNSRGHKQKSRPNISEKPPPTPGEKPIPKNGAGPKQRNGTVNNCKGNIGPRSATKSGPWEKIGNTKGRKQLAQKTIDAVPLNEVERKGG